MKGNMRKFSILALVIFSVLFSFYGQSPAFTITLGGKYYIIEVSNNAPVRIEYIEIKSDSLSPGGLRVGQSLQYRATAVLNNKSRIEVTDFVTWSSSNESIATISNQPPNKGLATAIAVGKTFIISTEPSSGMLSNQVVLEIQEEETTIDRIEIEADSPPPDGLYVGQSLQYRATAVLNDNSRKEITDFVTWSSSNGAIASISNRSPTIGVVEALSLGKTFIVAFDPSSGKVSNQLALDIKGKPVIECGTVADINNNYSCVRRTVKLKGYLTERLDSDNYMFYDGTGSIKIEYEGSIPLFTGIEIIGLVDSSEIEVSSYRLL